MGGGDHYPLVQKGQTPLHSGYAERSGYAVHSMYYILENTFHTVGGTIWGATAHSPHTQAAPISVLEAFTVSTAFTACIEGPVTLYIHALNAVDAVEASNNDLGYIYWKTHFILVGGI